jgi:hypothetical protein
MILHFIERHCKYTYRESNIVNQVLYSAHCLLVSKIECVYPNFLRRKLVTQDECYFYVNEHACQQWLAEGQQALHKKGNGQGIHVSDYMIETKGCLVLNATEIAAWATLPPEQQLQVKDARKIIYPGKNADI